MKVILDYMSGPNVITMALQSGRGNQRIGNGNTRKAGSHVLGFEDDARDREAMQGTMRRGKASAWPLEAGKGKGNGFSPKTSRKEMHSSDTLISPC